MHLMPDFDSTGLATIDGPAVLDRGNLIDHEPGELPGPTLERERFAGSRLRFIGHTQTSVAKRVRQRPRRAVVLGLEGALVDTREATALSWLVALHDGGFDVSIELLRHLSAVAPRELLRIVAGVRGNTILAQEMIRQQERNFRTWYLPRILPFIGARRLLQRMKSDGLRVIALSGLSADLVPDLVRASGVADLLDDIATSDGQPRDETLAEIIGSVISSRQCTREGIVLIGDSPQDIASGELAGIDVIALRCGGWTDAALQGAVAVYEDHVQLLSQFQSSPLGSFGGTITAPDYRMARVQ